MPVLKGDIQADGALVDAEVGWSRTQARRLRAALKPVPPPVAARALLDSGAEISCIDSTIIQTLGLALGAMVPTNVPAHSGPSFGWTHAVSLTIVHPLGTAQNLVLHDWHVLELSLSPIGYEVVIGRDVLAKCRFLYHGPAGRFRLAY